MSDVIFSIIVILAIVAVICFGPYIHWYFGTAYTEADRAIFKESTTYNEGMIDDLAKYRFEFNLAEDDIERKAIAELVASRFANFDDSKIKDNELKEFLNNCRNGKF